MVGVALGPHSAPGHLDVEARARSWPQHGDQINIGMVEPGRQYVRIGHCRNSACFKISYDFSAFVFRCPARDRRCANAALQQFISNIVGVLDADAENQPGFSVTSLNNYFIGDRPVDLFPVNCCLQFALNIFTAALVNAVSGNLRRRYFRLQRGKVLLEYQFFDAGRGNNIREQRRVVCDEAMPQPIRRGCQADHSQGRVN